MFSRYLNFLNRFKHVISKTNITFTNETRLSTKCAKLVWLTVVCVPNKKDIVNVDLSHEFLIKQAAVQVVDSLTVFIDKVTCALLDNYDTCVNYLEELLYLHEERIASLGNAYLEDQVWDKILEVKATLEDFKLKTQIFEMQLKSIESLSNCAAEAAFVSAADYAAIATNERLQLALQQIKFKKEKLKLLERELLEMEAKLADLTVKDFAKQHELETAEDDIAAE